MKSRRIGILTPTFLPKCSGAEVFHHNLAGHLVKAGHRPVVLAPRSRIRRLHSCGWKLPYELDAYPAQFWGFMKHHVGVALWLNRRALSRLQQKHRFDVWHTVVLYPSGVSFADWQSRSRVPGLVRAVGDDVGGLPGNGHQEWMKRLLHDKLPRAQSVVALSAGMADELSTLGVPRRKIRTMPNAVDCARFEGTFPGREAVRGRLGLPPDAFVFLCVARNHPQKDFPTLFRAFRSLRERMPGHEVHLAVAGRSVPSLRNEAKAAGLTDTVHFFEFGGTPCGNAAPVMPPPELVDLYRAADAFVLSSLLEGFSSALLEAMAASLPVVATDAPGIREVVRPDVEGMLVPCGDAVALAKAMGDIVEHPELRRRLADAARETARRYSWPVLTEAYARLYEELIAERGRA
ncbi:MAG: glycosyltransferase family 4 protein [Chthoniobacterales bacterium]|nr:glycosyltransferase family 4 protein [Chthoniobacterales bacterium]